MKRLMNLPLTLIAACFSLAFTGYSCTEAFGTTSPHTTNTPLVRLLTTVPSYHDTLQAALNTATGSATVQTRDRVLREDILLNKLFRYTLQGGFTVGFASQTGYTTLQGTMTIGEGSLVVDRLVITKPMAPEDTDDDGDGYTENQGDLNDDDPTIHPGAMEICGDGIDQDCDGLDPDVCVSATTSEDTAITLVRNGNEVADWAPLSDPSHGDLSEIHQDTPSSMGSYDTPDHAYGVTVVGNLAYVADGVSGLQIIDVSDPVHPTLKGNHNTPNYAVDVAVAGNLAYVADAFSGLQIIDVTDPVHPTLKGSCNTPDRASGVAVAGNLAYVADEASGLQIIDVSDPVNPTLKGSYDTPDYAVDVAVAGNLAYVAERASGLQIIDVSDPVHPTLKGSYDTPDFAVDVAVAGNLAYVADGYSGLQIIDVSDPVNSTLKGSYNTPPSYASGVAVAGNLAYVADGYSGLQIIDVSDPVNPTLKGIYNTPDYASGLAVAGNLAYMADAFSGLQIIDVSMNNRVTYTPQQNFNGLDRFIMRGENPQGGPKTYLYTITVTPAYDPPVADAGRDLQVRRNEIVQLDARGSSNPDNRSLTYHWAQTDGPMVFFDNPDSPTPKFVAPDVEGQLTFQVQVSDGLNTVTDTMNVFVVYSAPVANAGTGQSVGRSTTVTLNATGSSSPEGAVLTFHWTQTAGPTVVLSNPNASIASFTAPATFGSLTFQVQVSDGYGSSTDLVTISVDNLPPVSDAGSDQTVSPGSTVTLNGNASRDPDATDSLTYQWTLVWGPEGVTLGAPGTASPQFTAPNEASVLVFELAVEDPHGGRSTDQVTVFVSSQTPPPMTLQNTGAVLTFPAGSDLIPSQTKYVTVGATSVPSTGGAATAKILNGGAPSLGMVLDASSSLYMMGVHIPTSLAVYTDRFPELVPYLAGGSGSTAVNAQSTALGILLMNPYLLQANGVQRMAFLGTALTHPSFNSLRARIESVLATPGNRLATVLEDLQVKNYYAQIVTDLAAMVLPALEQGEAFGDNGVIAASSLEIMPTDSTAGDAGRQHEVILRRPSPEFRNPYFVFYSADIVKNPETSTDYVRQLLKRRTSLVELSWFEGISMPSYASTSYPFRPNTPYHVLLKTEDGLSTTVGALQVIFLLIGADSDTIEPDDIVELVADMDFTSTVNLGANALKGDWPAVAVNMRDFLSENFIVMSNWTVNTLLKLSGSGIEASVKAILTQLIGSSNVAGWTIKGAQLLNSTAPLLVDLFLAPEGCEMDVLWNPTMGYNDVLISTLCVPTSQHAPVLNVTASTLTGTAPLQVAFNAGGSYDPDGDTLYYSYTLNPLAKAPLATTPVYTHTFSRPGEYVMRAAVSDGKFGAFRNITITVNPPATNTAPVANAGPDQDVAKGATVLLNGLASSDPEGNALSWQWRQVNGLQRALRDPRTATPRFQAPNVDDVLLFELTVSDGQFKNSDLVQVVIGSPSGGTLTLSHAATLNEGSTVTGSVTLSQSASHDVVVWLTATPGDVVKIPAYVIVPAGTTSVTFSLEGLVDSDSAHDDFALQATAAGWVTDNSSGQVREIYTADIAVSTSGASGAQWTISGPGASGTYSGSRIFNDVAPGSYTVTYHAVSGYTTPAAQTKSIGTSGYYSFSGTYTPIATNTADLYISTLGAPNATWSISGPSAIGTYSGSQVFSNVTPGVYTVTFNAVSGYYTPSPQTKSVGTSGTYNFVGTYYTQSLGDVTVTRSTNIQLTLYDHGSVDGDIIDVYLNGSKIISNHTLTGPPGTVRNVTLNSGANTLTIKALNEGSVRPNTATIVVSDVASGDPVKVYNLAEGAMAGFNLIAP